MDPLIFKPYLRPMPWGGRRLESLLGKNLPDAEKYGESWELSGHPHHVSVVAEEPLRGTPLTELWRQSGESLLGRPVPEGTPFPLLFKFLDCHDVFSVQVHPGDEQAKRLRDESLGKTEAWVVLDALPDARIYAGLKPAVTRSDLERALDTETAAECLHSFTPRPGDCVFLPAGVVHAARGVLLAEVQQSSDITFRLFDWNRRDAQGRTRPLHRAEALASVDWSRGPVHPVLPRDWENASTISRSQRLVHCNYFQLDRHRLAGKLANPYPDCMSIWMILDGDVELRQSSGGYRRRFRRGETVLIPAAGRQTSWIPAADTVPTLLAVTLPAG
ncbi:MAG: class I mannose-6-phosphate isomerase [Pirellulales bacterium]|nr:class I mannose-6-phosphate isomerase [Pirellulales bacterium]